MMKKQMSYQKADSNNSFVKQQQAKMLSMMGVPSGKGLPENFNAEMSNDGERAKALAKKCGGYLDKKAFPVK